MLKTRSKVGTMTLSVVPMSWIDAEADNEVIILVAGEAAGPGPSPSTSTCNARLVKPRKGLIS